MANIFDNQFKGLNMPLPDKFIYTMHRVSKVVPPKRTILKDISLSFSQVPKLAYWVSMAQVNRPYCALWLE